MAATGHGASLCRVLATSALPFPACSRSKGGRCPGQGLPSHAIVGMQHQECLPYSPKGFTDFRRCIAEVIGAKGALETMLKLPQASL